MKHEFSDKRERVHSMRATRDEHRDMIEQLGSAVRLRFCGVVRCRQMLLTADLKLLIQ